MFSTRNAPNSDSPFLERFPIGKHFQRFGDEWVDAGF
jgi:hypothetical protein